MPVLQSCRSETSIKKTGLRKRMNGGRRKMTFKARVASIAVAVGFAASPVGAQPAQVEGIAAVVNDQVISLSDVRARISLAMLATNLPRTQEVADRLRDQVVRALIDESLQRQEAERLNILVPEEDVDTLVAQLAAQSGVQPDRFMTELQSAGIPATHFLEQIRTSLAWRSLIQRRIVPTVEIGDEEVEELLLRAQSTAGLPEYLLAEIFLAVDQPQDEAEVRRFAEQLRQEIANGASFPALAQQFSQSAGAASGGDLGWVLQGQLDPEIDAVLQTMRTGQLSEAIRTVSGYHIILLRDQRRAQFGDRPAESGQMTVARLSFPFPADMSQAGAVMAEAERVATTAESCEVLRRESESATVAALYQETGSDALEGFPPAIASRLAVLDVGQPTEPVVLAEAIAVFMICSRAEIAAADPDRETIEESLLLDRVDMLQRRYLRDLRNAAYIEVRL